MEYIECRRCGKKSKNESCGCCRRELGQYGDRRPPNPLKNFAGNTIDFPHLHNGREPSIGDRLARGFRSLRGE